MSKVGKWLNKQCPRCGVKGAMFDDDAFNPTSRLDSETHICPTCGLDESIGGNLNKQWVEKEKQPKVQK